MNTAQEFLREGILKARAGEFAEAIIAYGRALELDPNIVDGHYYFGEALRQQGDLVGAASLYRKALLCIGVDAQRLFRLGSLLQLVKDSKGAEIAYKATVNADPEHAPGHAKLAELLLGRRSYADAFNMMKRAAALQPDNLSYHHRLAIMGIASRNLQSAESALRAAITIDPANLTTYRRLSDVLLRLGRELEAEEAFGIAQTLAREMLPSSLLKGLAAIAVANPKFGRGEDAVAVSAPPTQTVGNHEGAFRWGRHAQDLTRSWTFLRPAEFDQLDALVEAPEWSLVSEMIGPGNGAIFVDTHIGLPHVSMARLFRSGLPLRFVNANSEALLSVPRDKRVNTRAADNHLALAKLIPFLRSGGYLFLAGDGGSGQRITPPAYKGFSASIAIGPPTLAFLTRCKTFWSASLWRDDKIVVEIVEGPQASGVEKREEFVDRFVAFYWAHYCRALESGPENINQAQYSALNANRLIEKGVSSYVC